jgi:DNA invertase Pin-like site-specific DNA recombinase
MNYIRCAIYTRKSSEEGLEQAFNSLDAQREACESFVFSQRHEGWRVIDKRYDDGGCSGGNTNRPALKQLLCDVAAGNIDTVVVYKVDRLTRSLADFSKIIEKFDAKQVSFVSVTQQFNTTTSMGRLTLNVLLSFAQFEREVTGERIRDKIAASKKKGMWMGGIVPVGYDAHNRKLHINKVEAETVRIIFEQFLKLGNVRLLQDWLRENDVRNKDGNHFSRGPIYKLLHNSIYIGLIRYKAETYAGEHQALVDNETWSKVQELLAANRNSESTKARSTNASLLTAVIFDSAGTVYTPTHTNKKGRRYRYYTSQATIRKRQNSSSFPTRIPAHDLESAVVNRVCRLLQGHEELLALLGKDELCQAGEYSEVLAKASSTALTLQTWSTSEKGQFLLGIIDRVIVHPKKLEIRIRLNQLVNKLLIKGEVSAAHSQQAVSRVPLIVSLECPFQHIPKGKSLRLVIGDSQSSPPPTSQIAIIKAVARARLWYEQLISGEVTDLLEIARLEGITPRYVRRIFRLVSASPASIKMFLNNEYRSDITLDEVVKVLPMAWNEQPAILARQE